MVLIREYLKLIRPRHWVKNIFVFAPIVFSGDLFDLLLFRDVSLIFLSFCFISSSVYCINDILDVNSDKAHPHKRNRPLASGTISLTRAMALSAILFLISIFISINISLLSVVCIFSYLSINIAYSLFLKKYPIIDVMCISSGFVIRMLSGTTVISELPSHWIFLTTFFLSLFLGFSKRRSELSVSVKEGFDPNITRKVLEKYSIEALDNIIASLMSITVLCYSLYATSSDVSLKFGNNGLIYTIPTVIYGTFYYYLAVVRGEMSEDQVEVLIQSKPIQLAVIIWSLTCVLVIYAGVFR